MDSQPDIDARDLPPQSGRRPRSASTHRAARLEAVADDELDLELEPQTDTRGLSPEAVRRWELFVSERVLYLRAALRLVGTHEDAEDLVQEVGLRILKHPRGPRDDLNLRAWCHGLVRNTALDFRRSAARRRRADHVELDELDGRLDASAPARETDVDARRVLEQPERLDDVERELLIRRYVLEQSSSEIALELRTSPPAVRMRLKRLLAKLRGFLTVLSLAAFEHGPDPYPEGVQRPSGSTFAA